MGSFFGGLLAENGLDVVLIDVWEEHVNNINKNGLRIVGVGGDRQVKVGATTSPEGQSPVDIVFVQCKAAHTKQAVLGAMNMFHEVREIVIIVENMNTDSTGNCVHIFPKRPG